jgi:hypothetical protein
MSEDIKDDKKEDNKDNKDNKDKNEDWKLERKKMEEERLKRQNELKKKDKKEKKEKKEKKKKDSSSSSSDNSDSSSDSDKDDDEDEVKWNPKNSSTCIKFSSNNTVCLYEGKNDFYGGSAIGKRTKKFRVKLTKGYHKNTCIGFCETSTLKNLAGSNYNSGYFLYLNDCSLWRNGERNYYHIKQKVRELNVIGNDFEFRCKFNF